MADAALTSISTDLRQGDICQIDLFPHWNIDTSSFVAGMGQKPTHVQMPALPKVLTGTGTTKRLVSICSYDCDLENPRDRKGILIAPVFALPKTHNRYEMVRTSGELRQSEDGAYFDYLQLFPVRVQDLTDVDVEMGVVDFSAMVSIGKAFDAAKILSAQKVFEIDDESRVLFRTKLSAFVGRPALRSAAAEGRNSEAA